MEESEHHSHLVIARCRLLWAGSLLLLVWSGQAAVCMEACWQLLKESSFFQLESCEPLVVIVCFAIYVGFFYLLDTHCPAAHRWHIHKNADVSHWKVEGKGGRLPETLLYIVPLAVADWIFPRRRLPDSAPGPWQLAGQVLGALLVYDALFTGVHLLCHRVPWLYVRVHAKHHAKAVQRACEAIRLTPAEELLDVGCSVAALNLLRCHPLSRLVYNVVIVYLITELHSGYDFPWSLQNVVPFGLWAGSRRHEVHHRHGRLYYQKFFTYIDNALIAAQARKRRRDPACIS